MSIFPTKILLATDGSQESHLAAQAAAELSKDTGSEVHVAYVLPSPTELRGHHLYSEEVMRSVLEKAEGEARSFLDEQAERIRSEGGKVAETHLRTGPPDKEIVRLSEELEAGTIARWLATLLSVLIRLRVTAMMRRRAGAEERLQRATAWLQRRYEGRDEREPASLRSLVACHEGARRG